MPAETPVWASSGIGSAAEAWRFRKKWSHLRVCRANRGCCFPPTAVLRSGCPAVILRMVLWLDPRTSHTLATNVPLNTSTRFILLWAVLLVAAPEKVAPLHECQTGPGIQEFAAGSVVEAPFLATWLFARFPLAWRTNNSANPGRVGCIGIIVSSCGFATWHGYCHLHCSFQVDGPVSFVLLLCVPWVLLHTIIRHPRYHRNFSFVTANKPPWIFPWLIPGARASRLITPWIILRHLSPLLWRHGCYAKIAGAIKCSNLKLVATQLDQPGNNIWMMQATQLDRAGNTNLAPFLLMDYLPLLAACSSPPFACIGWCSGSVMEATKVWLCILPHYSTTPLLQMTPLPYK